MVLVTVSGINMFGETCLCWWYHRSSVVLTFVHGNDNLVCIALAHIHAKAISATDAALNSHFFPLGYEYRFSFLTITHSFFVINLQTKRHLSTQKSKLSSLLPFALRFQSCKKLSERIILGKRNIEASLSIWFLRQAG